MVEEVVCEGENKQILERVLRTTREYWVMQARRVELEQNEAPVRRKRNEEDN